MGARAQYVTSQALKKLQKFPFQVVIMVQRGVKGFGSEKGGSPVDRMTQRSFHNITGSGKC